MSETVRRVRERARASAHAARTAPARGARPGSASLAFERPFFFLVALSLPSRALFFFSFPSLPPFFFIVRARTPAELECWEVVWGEISRGFGWEGERRAPRPPPLPFFFLAHARSRPGYSSSSFFFSPFLTHARSRRIRLLVLFLFFSFSRTRVRDKSGSSSSSSFFLSCARAFGTNQAPPPSHRPLLDVFFFNVRLSSFRSLE